MSSTSFIRGGKVILPQKEVIKLILVGVTLDHVISLVVSVQSSDMIIDDSLNLLDSSLELVLDHCILKARLLLESIISALAGGVLRLLVLIELIDGFVVEIF